MRNRLNLSLHLSLVGYTHLGVRSSDYNSCFNGVCLPVLLAYCSAR